MGDSSSSIASLIDGTANTKDLDFSYYASDAIISAIGKVFSAELKAASVTATDDYGTSGDLKSSAISKVGALKYEVIWEGSDSYSDGSWGQWAIEIYLSDGSLLGHEP